MSQAGDNPRLGSLKVGYIIKMFPRLSETFILNEVLELEQQGVELDIFSLKRPVDPVFHPQTSQVRSRITYLPEKLAQSPFSIAQAHLSVWRRFPRAWRHTLRNSLRHLRSEGDSGNLLAFSQACCVVRQMGSIRHFHAHYANVPAKIALLVHRITGATYSITTHAKDIFQNDPFASPKLQDRMRRASFVVANSKFSAEHILSGTKGAAEVRVVHNGLDLSAFPPRPSAPEQPLILGVGRLVEKKGFSDLITACDLLRQRGLKFSCEIVGTGALSNQLKEQIRTLDIGDRIKLVGPLPQQLLRERYARAMVLALPCKLAGDGDRDILPNVVKEAMAVGVPVLTTQLDGIEELIEDEVSGLLVQPGDTSALAAKLELLLGDSGLRRRLAANGRKVVEERFDRRVNFAGLRKLFQSASSTAFSHALEIPNVMPQVYDTSCVR